MDTSRRDAWQVFVVIALAGLILMEENRFGSPRPETLGVGLLVLLLAIWQAANGKAYLFFRSVTKSDAPRQFWFGVFFTALLGMLCVLLSYL